METMTLYTYAISQSSEKIRWALDYAGLPYEEKRLAPFAHFLRGDSPGGGPFSPMPVLQAGGLTLTGSTQILEWLAQHRAPFAPMPRDAALRVAAMDMKMRMDYTGLHLLRWTGAFMLKQHSLALRLWTLDASPLQSLALRAGYPLIRRLFEHGLGFGADQMRQSRDVIDIAVEELNQLALSRRKFLVGTSFSVADITAAAIFSPIACPDEHPIYSRRDYNRAMKTAIESWTRQPGMDWVRATYARHRGTAAAPLAVSRRAVAA